MSTALRSFLLACAAAVTLAAQQGQKPPEPPEPPEEDEGLREKEYSFNPLQAEKEFKIAGYYLKKGSLRAASQRYIEATRWNPSLAEAYLKLGEVLEKLKDTKGSKEAYAKYLELAPDAKNAGMIRRKLGQ
ncbi:MAG: tetratricopeptide repeat protein [Acidobacteria bacterium]|nr:tetratricopeptide repeat protein [Acidobacteriota bacterium]